MTQNSKPLAKGDDASKELIIEILGGNHTYGFDIDSIYYIESERKWVIIEFLKCDHPKVDPSKSHPSRYWKNWRKFASLWKLKLALNAELYLVNYEDESHVELRKRSSREFAIIHVKNMNPTQGGGITEEEITQCDFEKFKSWFLDINTRAGKL